MIPFFGLVCCPLFIDDVCGFMKCGLVMYDAFLQICFYLFPFLTIFLFFFLSPLIFLFLDYFIIKPETRPKPTRNTTGWFGSGLHLKISKNQTNPTRAEFIGSVPKMPSTRSNWPVPNPIFYHQLDHRSSLSEQPAAYNIFDSHNSDPQSICTKIQPLRKSDRVRKTPITFKIIVVIWYLHLISIMHHVCIPYQLFYHIQNSLDHIFISHFLFLLMRNLI